MSDKPILPTADEILIPVLERFYELRPTSFQHINLRKGVYWHPFLGWRAQCAQTLKRLHSFVRDNRLTTAEAQALVDYVASEYDTVAEVDPTFAVGELSLTRTETATAGDIRAGTRFVRKANLTTQIPLKAATYETLIDLHFDVGQAVAGPVPIRSITVGSNSNHPIRTDDIPHGVSASGLFDRTISVSAFSAAGGSEGANDDYVRDYAVAFSKGQYGPTADASRYGALRGAGVRNLLVYDEPGTGTQKILVADSTWASSARWAALVQQAIYDADLVGNGCKVSVDRIRNIVISIEAAVVLRDKNYANETTEIDEAIRKTLTDYFNERSDWNVWKSSALRAAVTRSHSKILSCTEIIVRDTTGAVLSEIASPDYTTEQFHFFLANNAVSATYVGPT